MRLFVGKNHEREPSPVQSFFRLVGKDEDALTYALGFLLARESAFCASMVRRLGVFPRYSVGSEYSVHLQEITDSKFGRRDIVIEDRSMRLVLEAKIGGAEPTTEQLLKYADEEGLWNTFDIRGVVALTQIEMAATARDEVSRKLARKKIKFNNCQWSEVLDLALNFRSPDNSDVSLYLFHEFIRFIRKDYSMGYFDAEIHIQDVNQLNEAIFKESWMYVTGLNDKKAPLYFAPYFTSKCEEPGISMISRVLDTEIAVLAHQQDLLVDSPSEEHSLKWQNGMERLKVRAKKEGFADRQVRLLYLDEPIQFRDPPLTKLESKEAGMSKQIPSQIPKGFSLGFDDFLKVAPGFG